MNVGHARLALRERAPVDALDVGARFVAAHPRAYATLGAAVLVPGWLLTLAASRLGWAVGWLVAAPLWLLADAAFVALGAQLVFDDAAGARSALAATLARAPGLVALHVLGLAALAVGGACLLLPGLLALAGTFFATEALVLERASPLGAVRRSFRLFSAAADGPAGAVVLPLFVLGAIFVGDLAGRSLAEDLLLVTPPAPITEAGGSVFGAAGLWVAVPAVATMRLALYLNTRTRLEGWDVQAKMRAAAGGRMQAGGEAP